MVKPYFEKEKQPHKVSAIQTDESKRKAEAAISQLVQGIMAEGWRCIKREYKELQAVIPEGTLVEGNAPKNLEKNRYRRVVCYDHSRVQIESERGESYINANYVDGYNQPKAYIVTQGPLARTVLDFWQMIWQQRVEHVVMLTKTVEGRVSKCCQYWAPKEGAVLIKPGFQLKTLQVRACKSFTQSLLELTNVATGEQQLVTHWHYLEWPDQGVTDSAAILEFIEAVNEARNGCTAPIIIHCSAGVGRAGTLVAIMNCLEELRQQGTVNVAANVRRIRQQRAYCITTVGQFETIYRTIFEWAGRHLNLGPETLAEVQSLCEAIRGKISHGTKGATTKKAVRHLGKAAGSLEHIREA